MTADAADGRGLGWVIAMYKVGYALAKALPKPVSEHLADAVYGITPRFSEERRLLAARNLQRVDPELRGDALDEAVVRAFQSYGRYWVDSFRLPKLSPAEIDANFSYEGYEHIQAAIDSGHGPLMVIPHLGGWEWAAHWVTAIMDTPVTAVVEPVEPPELFEFFVGFREELGMKVVPLGPKAGSEVLRSVKDRHVICLLCDRDIEGNGVEVEFFGERTTLPAGPATLALRTGAPLLPSAIYFRGDGHHGVVRPPIPAERQGRLRDDVTRITQDIAHALEDLIRAAPEQWHMQQPNWPSDWDALEAIGKHYPRPGEH